MEGIADRLLDGMMNGPLGDSAVSRAERRRLRDTACRAAWMMAEQLKGSSFSPVELEINFGDEEPCVRLHPKGGESTLAGRIDRIDEWPERGYLRVIDYKRGGRAMKLNEVYSGLQLQLIIYLAAAMKRRGGKCAGVYYFSVADPIFECESRELSAADDMRRDKLRLSGIFPNDPEILYAMSPEPERVMKVRMTKEGGFYKGTPVADAEEFDKLIQTTIGYCEKYVSEIREGNTEIAPVRQKNRSACDFCEYRAICATDGSKDRIFD